MIHRNTKNIFWYVLFTISIVSFASFSSAKMYNIMSELQVAENVEALRYTKLFVPLFILAILLSIRYLKLKEQIGNSLLVLCLYNCIVTVINADILGLKDSIIISHLGLLLIPPLAYYTFKIYLNRLNIGYIEFMIAVMTIFMMVHYFVINNYVNIEKELGMSLNVSYLPLISLSALLFSKNKYIRILCLFLMFLLVIDSGKRAGLVGLGLGLLFLLLKPLPNLKIKRSKLITGVFMIIILLCIFIPHISLLDERVFLSFVDNGGDDVSSGRFGIFATTFSMFYNSDFLNMLFGHGFDTVVINSPLHRSAHSDFIEILYDFGVVGFFLYIRLHTALINRIMIMYKNKNENYYSAVITYSLFLALSLFSHLYIYPYFYLMTMVFSFYNIPFITSSLRKSFNILVK